MTGYIKLLLMVVAMTLGFFLIYGLIWLWAGQEMTEIAVLVLAMLAMVSEVAYLLWVAELR